MYALKAEVVRTGHYKVLAVPFAGPLKGADLDGQYFSPRTDTKPHWFSQHPVLWHHGLDKTYADTVEAIGQQGEIKKESDGWWADMWLDKQAKYFAQIDNMIAREKLYGSSGTMPHLVKAASDGELLVWPHIEQTLSPIPRNPYSVVRATKALEDFEAAGIDTSELRAISSDLRNLTSGFGPGDVAATAEQLASLSKLEDIVRKLGG